MRLTKGCVDSRAEVGPTLTRFLEKKHKSSLLLKRDRFSDPIELNGLSSTFKNVLSGLPHSAAYIFVFATQDTHIFITLFLTIPTHKKWEHVI